MQLTIKLLQSGLTEGNTLQVSVEPDYKISDLKDIISEILNLPPSSFRLLMIRDFSEILLTDSESIDSYSLSDDSRLILDIFSEISMQEHDSRERAHTNRNLSEQQQPIPQRDWLGLLIEKIKSGSLTGMLQIVGEYEKERQDHTDDEDNIFSMANSEGWTLMHYACQCGASNIVQLLVARNANPNRENEEDMTPLMIACKQGQVECVRSLLKHPRIQVNKMTQAENAALHKACKKGSAIIVQMLIEHGACMVLEDQNLMIPLQYGASQEIFEMIPKYMGEIELQKTRGEYSVPTAEGLEGEIYFTGSLVIHDKIMYAVLDPDRGNFMCFAEKSDYDSAGRPLVFIRVVDIWDIRYRAGLQFGNKEAQCFTLISKEGNLTFYSLSKEVTEDWISKITRAIDYCQINKIGYHITQSIMAFKTEISGNFEFTSHLDSDTQISFKSFTILEEIGSGSFGKVYKVVKNDTKQVFALKQLNKEFLVKQKQLKYAIGECKILAYLNHPFIIKMNFAFQTPKNLYMVLDYCPNGDLMTHLGEKTRFPEAVCRFFIAEVILAIEYLHSLDIVYRDLKPENILLDRAGHIRLADFGLAKENVNPTNPAMSFCGSPAYLAPELLSKSGSEKSADVYGIGAILFELLSGMPPFYSDNIKELFRNIKRGMLQFPKIIRTDAQDLMRQLMHKDPKKRPKLNQVKSHVFFKEINWEELEMKITKPPRLGGKWVQMDDYSEKPTGAGIHKIVDDMEYNIDDVMDLVADFNFSRSSASYIG